MDRYDVGGMSCAACSARVEKAVNGVEGVTSCSVSLLTNSMTVEGSAAPEAIITAVEKAGYTAKAQNAGTKQTNKIKIEKPNEVKPLVQRFVVSLVLLLILMYFSMGHVMWGFPLPSFFGNNPIAVALVQLILSATIMVINKRFFISGFKGLIHRAPNMDTLVSLGSAASFIWSVYELFMMTVSEGDHQAHLLHGLYFESAAMILVLITLGKILEAYSKGRTTDALQSLMDLSPKTAVLEKDGREVEVPIENVQIGDIFILRPGMSVPVDGVVIEGESAIDESMLTGESIPVDKAVDSNVSSATINQSGYLKCRATRVGEDTTLSQIIRTVYEASSTKAPIARIADKVSGVFVPIVMGIALITLIIWLITGVEFSYALERGISVLVISCPCALGLATPVSIMVGNGVGAKAGILFKNAEALETAGKTQIVALDKTGTITKGEPEVTDIIPAQGITEEELLQIAYSIERLSSHPLADAITAYAEAQNLSPLPCDNFQNLAGHGLTGSINGEQVFAGSFSFVQSKIDVDREIDRKASALANTGKTPMLFCKDGKLLGVIAAADTVKEDSKEAIAELKEMEIRVVMITGDNEKTAKAIGDAVGVARVYAGVLPSGKSEIISELKQYGRTAMAGDGINDAPALTVADTGIAIGSGTDIAIDSADIVLVGSRLSDLAAAIRLSRQTLRNIHENLFWAFIYNIIGIPLAAGLWIPLFGISLNPMFGAAAMSLSSFCVVTNALRLNLFNPHKRHNKFKKAAVTLPPAAENNDKGEPTTMTTTVTVEGMMCPMCEKHVTEAIEKNFDVESVKASREKNSVEIDHQNPLDNEKLFDVIKEAGYQPVAVSD
ncbi:MAG: heavy metal translocating P-type ATPase [Ruminococcus sp.]|uniref:heavy metal translocating P-type ATPase n=1 Tax=Ruminococcus sp. TaxID=41978 RepID=UPI002872E8EB|nr:heavy metal translocating P-type ATPase [Ruminococcus sp.]MBQ3285702.1 heavy metal translocating P-type ATPase [Ruminococcus sp.]